VQRLLHAYDTLANVKVAEWPAKVALDEVYRTLQWAIEDFGSLSTRLDGRTRRRLARGVDMTCRYCGVYMNGHHEGTCPVARAVFEDECPYCGAQDGEEHADQCPLYVPADQVEEEPDGEHQ